MATTPYNFVTPIRYYKANDPYYYEVDNIPIRQLEENILYVKDKVGKPIAGNEISIYDIKELRPKVDGGRTIKVNAGRFISRINDAYNMNKPLAQITRETIPVMPDVLPVLSQKLWTKEKNDAVWDAFTGPAAAAKSYNTNGLETFFTFYSQPVHGGAGSSYGVKPITGRSIIVPGGNQPWYAGQDSAWETLWPQLVGNTTKFIAGSPALGETMGWSNQSNFRTASLPSLHILFVQMWRGVFRTAVVDVPESTIEIPPFKDEDFRYWDGDPPRPFTALGDGKIIAGATHRIDLLVAYSMPIDSSSTTIVDFAPNTNSDGILPPTSTTKPMLGLVMGAGVGLMKSTERKPNDKPEGIEDIDSANYTDLGGHKKIVGNVSDQDPLANAGITDINGNKVHGSFPSPDDLLHVAPILALDIGGDSAQDLLDQLQLIGQAALPLAYIVVKKDQAEIVQADIIDIRPFLRTTEFTYNERAGVAAANPPLSFANPAVGAYQLQNVTDKLRDDIVEGSKRSTNFDGRGVPIYSDYIMGGLAYGVEGTLLTMCDGKQRKADPFGTDTTNTIAFKSKGDLKTYSFASFGSSKAFMEETDEDKKKAYLEWVVGKQGYLKRWLSNPNQSIYDNKGTYLGLPPHDQKRNIPLWPEWDMPVDQSNYAWMVGQWNVTKGTQAGPGLWYSPQQTFWMWFEALSPYRGFMYAPGGTAYTKALPAEFQSENILDKQIGFGWGPWSSIQTGEVTVGMGNIVASKKTLTVEFPGWVKAYDVMAEYSNCSPATNVGGDTTVSQHFNMGTGLSVSKGMIGETANNKAVFTITSFASTKLGEVWGGPPGHDQINTSRTVTQHNSPGPVDADNPAQWMMYSVCVPQYKQTKFGPRPQTDKNSRTARDIPKIGGAMYPTVKFTIIAYEVDPLENNDTYGGQGQGCTLNYAPQQGSNDTITTGMAPWQPETLINLS